MKSFKRKTLALVLASVVTIAGSFATDRYQNDLKNISFQNLSNGGIDVVLETKYPFNNDLTPRKLNDNTYVIMLPEVYGKEMDAIDLTATQGRISNINVRTMPYSTSSNGYTRITITTPGELQLTTSNRIYIPSQKQNQIADQTNTTDTSGTNKTTESIQRINNQKVNSENSQQEIPSYKRYQSSPTGMESPKKTPVPPPPPNVNGNLAPMADYAAKNQFPVPETTSSSETGQKYLLLLGILLIIVVSVYLFVHAKERLINVVGENFKLDLDDTEDKSEKEKKKQKTKNKQIREAVEKLNKTYPGVVFTPRKIEFTKPSSQNKTSDDEAEDNVLDLDKLFEENKSETKIEPREENNSDYDALSDFLSEFSIDDANEPIEEEEELYNEKDYNEIVNNSDLIFSKEDIDCIENLLSSEISDAAIKELRKNSATSPIKAQKPSRDKLLAELVSDYAIKQDITFTDNDIDILRKLMSVEIDRDFVTDLRTNPQKTMEMEKAIRNETPKPAPVKNLVLNVKDMLPNLSEELKKQGGRRIESNAKPETVYFSEGYDVSTLAIGDVLPNLSEEINNTQNRNNSSPSAAYDIVDNSYSDTVKKLEISGLPDLEDVMAHPEKYENSPKEEEQQVNEEDLLNRINNVTFKPFDDGTRDFEIINNIEEQNTPNIEDIKKEFSQFNNFEISNYDNELTDSKIEKYSNVENKNFEEDLELDIDSIIKKENEKNSKFTQKPKDKSINILMNKLENNRQKSLKREKDLYKIKEDVEEYKVNKLKTKSESDANSVLKTPELNESTRTNCIIEGVSYLVIDQVVLDKNLGCYLTKKDAGYSVVAYEGNNLFVIKDYDNIRGEKISARTTENLDNEQIPRYIIKVGLNKFIVDLKDNQIVYVMDLC